MQGVESTDHQTDWFREMFLSASDRVDNAAVCATADDGDPSFVTHADELLVVELILEGFAAPANHHIGEVCLLPVVDFHLWNDEYTFRDLCDLLYRMDSSRINVGSYG